MKNLTILLLMIASLITGYVIAQYNRGTTRLYYFTAEQGTITLNNTNESSTPMYFLEMNTLSMQYPYVSDEQPKYTVKLTQIANLFKYWTKDKGKILTGILTFKSQDSYHKKWVKIIPKTYDAAANKAVFELEPLSLRREGLEQSEEPEKIIHTTILHPHLSILSINTL